MPKSLNRVQLIGNLTRDPELRYTPNGTAVCSFGIATNRNWTTDTGEKHEEVEFHRIVSWNKLAELCSQFLVKGRKVYVQGRLATRKWTAQDGQQRNATEVVIDDMILLDSRRSGDEAVREQDSVSASEDGDKGELVSSKIASPTKPSKKTADESNAKTEKQVRPEPEEKEEEIVPDDIPF